MVVVGLAVGWCVQQRRLEAALAKKTQELKIASDEIGGLENVLYNEHLEHRRTTRDLSKMVVDILSSEHSFGAYRQKYLEPVKGQYDLAVHMFDAYDAARATTVEQIERLAKAREESYVKRVIELEAEKKNWQERQMP
jgi:hypothetical protein